MGKHQAPLHPKVRKEQVDFGGIVCAKDSGVGKAFPRNPPDQDTRCGTILGAGGASSAHFCRSGTVERQPVAAAKPENPVSGRLLGKGDPAGKTLAIPHPSLL